jgi:hypothetical protein
VKTEAAQNAEPEPVIDAQFVGKPLSEHRWHGREQAEKACNGE